MKAIEKVVLFHIIMQILLYFSILFGIRYTAKLLKSRFNCKFILYIAALVMTVVTSFLLKNKMFIPFFYLVLAICNGVVFYIIYDDDIIKCVDCITSMLLNVELIRNILIGLVAITFNVSMYRIIEVPGVYILSYILAKVILSFICLYFNKEYWLNIGGKILSNIHELKFVVFLRIGLFIFTLNYDFTYYYAGDLKFSTLLMVLESIVVLMVFYYIFRIELKYIKWKGREETYTLMTKRLEEQEKLNAKRSKYSDLIKIYNHDFKHILRSAKIYIEVGNIQKARDMLATADREFNKIVDKNKKYSNKVIIDIILAELSDKCDIKNIEFKAKCYIPDNSVFNDLDLSRLFSNIINNAYEACEKQPVNHYKKIEVNSYTKDGMLIIYCLNTFDGNVIWGHKGLFTTKKNKEHHGFGVNSIKQIVESKKGMVLIKVDEESKLFKLYIKIPLELY